MSDVDSQGSAPSQSSLDGTMRFDQKDATLGNIPTSIAILPESIDNDAINIQAALDSASAAGGGTVFLRNGTYLLNNSLTLPNDTNLIGETAGGVILDFQNQAYQITGQGTNIYNTGTISVNNFSTTVTGSGTSWNSSMIGQSVFISGLAYLITDVASATSLTIENSFEILSVSGINYVIATPASDITLQNFTIQNSINSNGAIYFIYSTSITIDTVNIFNSTIGANFDWNFTIEYRGGYTSDCGIGLQIIDSATATLYDFEVYGSTGTNVILTRFINCSYSNFTNSTATGNAITLTSCKNLSIYDFAIQSAGAIGLELISCSDIEISSCNIIEAVSDGIKLTSNNTDISIDNTSFLTNGGYGVNVAASSDNQTTITGSFFSNNVSGTINDSGTSTLNSNNQPLVIGGYGNVAGASSSTDNDFTQFSGTSGKLLKDGGLSLDTSSTLASNSDVKIPSQKAVKSYVDNAVLAQRFKEAVGAATTANLVGLYLNGSSGVGATFTYTATGVDVIDGVTLTLGMRILLKNQTSTFQNGIYTVTTAGALGIAGILTRATDFDQASDIQTGDSVFVTAGTTQTSTTWVYTGGDSPVIGTDAITWVQSAGQGSFSGGNGITITGTSIAINTAITADLTTSQSLSNKVLSDVFMGVEFDSQSSLAHSTTLLASTNYIVHDTLKIGSGILLTMPSTSTLAVKSYTPLSYILTGWIPFNQTLTFSSSTAVTVPNDWTGFLSVGDKIFFGNTTAKYFYITSVSVSGYTTTINLTGGTDYTVANATITNAYYSKAVSPVNFPQWFTYVPTYANLTVGNGTDASKFRIIGKEVTFYQQFTLGTTSSIGTGATYTLPLTTASTYTGGLMPLGGLQYFDTSAGTVYNGYAIWKTTTTAQFIFNQSQAVGTAVTGASSSATFPVAFGTGDIINTQVTYAIP